MSEVTERFSDRVADYVAYRPNYPDALIEFAVNEFGLGKDGSVADIGSGTGISAKPFLELGCTVFGVEPNAAMRQAAEACLANFANFKSIAATAEETGLERHSLDVVICAQAYHWFDKHKAAAEFKRILRPGGKIALVWNERQLDSTDFLEEYEQFLIRYGTDYETVRHDLIAESEIVAAFGRSVKKAVFSNSQQLDFAGLKGRAFSSSYMPAAGSPEAPLMENDLLAIFTRHQKDGKIEIIYDCNIFYLEI